MIHIRSKTILKTMLGFVLFIVLLNIAGYFLMRNNMISEAQFQMVYLDSEKNLPTFFSSILLLTASVILFLIGWQGKQKVYWYLLGGIFCFLALDENISIHENLTGVTRSMLNTETLGVFYFAWVIPYGIATLMLVVILYNFFRRLPKKTKVLFLISGLIFVLGAIGMEMLAGRYAEQTGFTSRTYRVLAFLEEIMEMIGGCLFIFALLDYIEENLGKLVVSIQK